MDEPFEFGSDEEEIRKKQIPHFVRDGKQKRRPPSPTLFETI
jgi:hypothetical protein